jgi:hypothetical protein
VIPGVIESDVCFLPMVTPETVLFFKIVKLMLQGIMPFPGGYMQQPNIIISVFDILGGKLKGDNNG